MARHQWTTLSFDDLVVGDEWESPRRTITPSDVVLFAGLSGDFNPIHMDHHAAGQGPFGRPVAHGLLGFAIASGLMSQAPRLDTLAFLAILEWRFHHPILFGDTIHGLSRVDALEPSGNGRRGVVTWYRRILNQDDRVVQEGRTQTLVRARPGRKAPKDTSDGDRTPQQDVTRLSLRQRCCAMILPPIIRAFDPNHLVLDEIIGTSPLVAGRRGDRPGD